MKHFGNDRRDDARSDRNVYTQRRRLSPEEINEKAREYAAASGEPFNVVKERLEKYYKEMEREAVKVYHYAKPGDSDYDEAFHEDKEVATALASRRGNEKVYEDFAWPPEEEGEKHVLLTDDELKEYRKKHHRYSS